MIQSLPTGAGSYDHKALVAAISKAMELVPEERAAAFRAAIMQRRDIPAPVNAIASPISGARLTSPLGPRPFIRKEISMTFEQILLEMLALNGAGLPGVSNFGIRMSLSAAQIMAVSSAIPALPSDNINIRWNSGARVQANDALYNFIRDTLGLSTAQMDAIMQNAATYE